MKFGKILNMSKKTLFNYLLLLGIILVVVVLYKYNKDKTMYNDTMTTLNPATLGSNDMNKSNEQHVKENVVSTNPSDLLPKNENNEWSSLNPVSPELKNINYLSAGSHTGINTVGSSLRNPNLQLRSEPVIPKGEVGPWNNTTIEADPYRRSLEIDGCV